MSARRLSLICGAALVAALLGCGLCIGIAGAAGAGQTVRTGPNGYQTIVIPPPPVTGPRGRARIEELVVTHTGVNVEATCSGSANAVCTLIFQLSGGVPSGLASSMTRTMIVGTHVFHLTLNGNAQSLLNHYRYFYAYLKVLQKGAGSDRVLIGKSFEMTS